MNIVQIKDVSTDLTDHQDLLAAVTKIADVVAYPASVQYECEWQLWAHKGFLGAAFGFDKYEALAAEGKLHVVIFDGVLVAFAVVHAPLQAVGQGFPETRPVREQFGRVPVINQIATKPGYQRRGFARLLNNHVAAQFPDLPVFVTFPEMPRNISAEHFHAALGYEKWASFLHPDGTARGIWRRPSARDRGQAFWAAPGHTP
jgi:GNAT superfamily N-acetyltransferase